MSIQTLTNNIIFVFTGFLLLFSTLCYPDAPLYINSLKAKIFTEPNINSKVIKELNRGKSIQLIQKKGVWTKIAWDTSFNGWIYSMLLSKKKPQNVIHVLENSKEITKIQRARASLYSGTAAARGLTDSSSELNRKYPPNTLALSKMEALKVSAVDALKFLNSNFKKTIPSIKKTKPKPITKSIISASNLKSIKTIVTKKTINITQIFSIVPKKTLWSKEKQKNISEKILIKHHSISNNVRKNIAISIKNKLFSAPQSQRNIATLISNGFFEDINTQTIIVQAIQDGVFTDQKAIKTIKTAKNNGIFYKWSMQQLKERG